MIISDACSRNSRVNRYPADCADAFPFQVRSTIWRNRARSAWRFGRLRRECLQDQIAPAVEELGPGLELNVEQIARREICRAP
jgi:hypothetical protein